MSQPPIPPTLPPNIPPELAVYYQNPTIPYQQPTVAAPVMAPVANRPPRRERLGLWLTVLIIAWLTIPLVLLVAFVLNRFGGTASNTFNVNEVVRAGDWSLTVSMPDKPQKTLQWNSRNVNPLNASGQWWVVPVEVKNNSSQDQQLTTDSFQLVDDQGQTYDPSSRTEVSAFISFKSKTALGDTLASGDSVQSLLVFDVPASATGLKLVFKQGNQPTVKLPNS